MRTTEVQAAEITATLNTDKGTSEAEASIVLEEVVPEVAINLASKVVF